jgi:hypothetical protein
VKKVDLETKSPGRTERVKGEMRTEYSIKRAEAGSMSGKQLPVSGFQFPESSESKSPPHPSPVFGDGLFSIT